MLVLTRRPGETLLITPRPNVTLPPDWAHRPIEIRILRVDGNKVRIGIEAAAELHIARGEQRRWDDA